MRKMLRGKIHRATVTGADLHYEGSITIDSDLMRDAGMLPNEAVQVWNVNNGERFETYTVEGEPGSGVICVNGAAAHKVEMGHLIIIAAFGWMKDSEAEQWKPRVVFVDEKNRRVDSGRTHEIGGQASLKKVWG